MIVSHIVYRKSGMFSRKALLRVWKRWMVCYWHNQSDLSGSSIVDHNLSSSLLTAASMNKWMIDETRVDGKLSQWLTTYVTVILGCIEKSQLKRKEF
jgi:hypothetical protein